MSDQSTKLSQFKEHISTEFKKFSSLMSYEELKSAIQTLIDFVKKQKEMTAQEMEAMKVMMNSAMAKMASDQSTEIGKGKKEMMDYCTQEIRKLLQEHKSRLTEIDNKMAQIRDGKDADTQEVALLSAKIATTSVLEQIPKVMPLSKELPKAGDLIASALELLPEGEKLKLEAIEGLRKELDELKQLRGRSLGGGGFSYGALTIHQINEEVPVNSGDDLSFTINHTPNPTASLKVYRNGQRLHIVDDFTLSGKTITLLTALTAGEIFFVDYQT